MDDSQMQSGAQVNTDQDTEQAPSDSHCSNENPTALNQEFKSVPTSELENHQSALTESKTLSSASDSTSSDTESDDEESGNYAMGYTPLSQDPEQEDENDDSQYVKTCDGPEADVSKTLSVDLIQSSHQTLTEDNQECTSAVKLEDNEVDKIKQAMSGFSLPSSAIPEWARRVPENVWKSELINGIRTKKE